MSQPQTQINLTRAEFEAARQRIADAGITLTGDSGEAEKDGVKLSYAYTEPVLTIVILEKPFLLPELLLMSKIRNWFQPGVGKQ